MITQEERNVISEMISGCVTGINARIESQNEIINIKLDGINDHLAKINGKTSKHGKSIEIINIERAENRQKQLAYFKDIDTFDNKIRILEDESLTHKSVRKFMGIMFFSGITLGGFIIGIIQLVINSGV